MTTPRKAKKYTPAARNEFGRTATEEAAWVELSTGLTKLLKGELTASASSYNLDCVNIGTGANFSGRNKQLASLNSLIKGDTRFISAKEAISRKWEIKGAKQVFFRRPITAANDDTDEKENNSRRFFKSYGLFCLSDIKHDEGFAPIGNGLDDSDSEALCEALLTSIDSITNLTRQATLAHVIPDTGTINIPPSNNFKSYRIMASSCLHELAHFVNIKGVTVQQYQTYRGYEEVCAEITALLCAQSLGLGFEPKNISYIDGWLDHAKTTHTDALEKAFTDAAKRADLVLSLVTCEVVKSKAA